MKAPPRMRRAGREIDAAIARRSFIIPEYSLATPACIALSNYVSAAVLEPCPCLIGGDWREISGVTASAVHNPSTGETIAEAPMCTAEEVNAAIEAAAAALPQWKETPPVERVRILFRFKMLLEDNFEEIARCITRENGKTLLESRGDLRRGIEMVEFACGAPSLLTGETL